MKVSVPLVLVAFVMVLLTGCPNLSSSGKSEFKKMQERIPELRPYVIDTHSMAEAYKQIEDKEEGKVRPRMIGTVLSVLPAGDPNAAALISENNLPEVPGAGVAIVYTPHGWTVMLAPPGLEVKANQVVEFTLPAAIDFKDLDDLDKMATRLAELQREGSVGIQSVRSDCAGNISGQGPFSMSCNGKPADFVVNASQFTQTTLDWLNNPGPSVSTSSLPLMPPGGRKRYFDSSALVASTSPAASTPAAWRSFRPLRITS
jgi:hypothetical protein